MTVETSHIKKANVFLSFFGEDIISGKLSMGRELSEKVVLSLITVTDALLKAENYHFKKNISLWNKKGIFENNLSGMTGFIREYLKNFDSVILKFSKTERQTFLFVLENLGEYFTTLISFRSEKEKDHLFTDFTFWFDNFIKFFNQKINGEIEKVSGESTEEVLIHFRSRSSYFPVYPFILYHKGTPLFFKTPDSGGLIYSDINGEKSRVIGEADISQTIFKFLFSNLSLDKAVMVKPGKDKPYRNYLDTSLAALRANAVKNYKKSIEYLQKLPEDIIDMPLFRLLRLDNLEKSGMTSPTKDLVEKFIGEYPLYHQGYEILGRIYESEKNFDEAIINFSKALSFVQNRDLSEKIRKLKNRTKDSGSRQSSESLKDSSVLNDVLSTEDRNSDIYIPRSREIRQIMEILVADSCNNIIILGDSGVGKSALVRMFAQKMLEGDVPEKLKKRKVMEINFVSLLVGTKYRGQFEEKVVKLLDEFKSRSDILLLEDIHLMMAQGVARGTSLDLINILKQFLKEHSIQVIATTSYEEFKNSIERDSSFNSYFQKLILKEMSPEQTVEILRRRAKISIEKDNIIVPDDIVKTITENGRKGLPGKKLPDAALTLYDRCISRVKLRWEEFKEPVFKVTEEDVASVISDLLNLPESDITISIKKRLSGLESKIKKEIIGQDDAVKRLVSGIVSSKLGYEVNGNRPDGVFLFVGPTGVGKSETALVLAKYLLGSRDNVIRIDMSEYMERFTYSRFVGAAPGYVGYNDATQLTDKIRKNPYSVILLDEIEKADYQLLNIFLQVFDAGRMTDARGNEIDFSHTTIVMTSNIGTSLYSRNKMGYNGYGDNRVSSSALQKSLRRFFSPEFLNRIDDIIVFEPLERRDIEKIIDLQLSASIAKLKKEGKTLLMSDEVKDFLVKNGYSKEYGARNIARTIKKKILERIAFLSLDDRWDTYDTIECIITGGNEIEIIPSGVELESGEAKPLEKSLENKEKIL